MKIFIIFIVLAFIFIGSILIYYKTPKVSVLMYHDVFYKNELPKKALNDKGQIVDDCVVSAENFKEQMRFLKKKGYHTLSLDEFYDFVINGAKIPEKSVLITFDDGRKSNFINAYPILKENGFRAVIFLVTSKIPDKTSEFNPEKYQRMSFEEIEKSKELEWHPYERPSDPLVR